MSGSRKKIRYLGGPKTLVSNYIVKIFTYDVFFFVICERGFVRGMLVLGIFFVSFDTVFRH